jgi:2,4-dienoyl-CoA reductase-like NADH-dependent reductase (Old Yellow Enzyme family)
MIATEPFKELYFLEDALRFRERLKLPLVYVGGAVNREGIDKVLNSGFEFVQMGRALIRDPEFVNHMRQGVENCGCDHINYCIARMYSREMKCYNDIENLPCGIRKEIAAIKKRSEAHKG